MAHLFLGRLLSVNLPLIESAVCKERTARRPSVPWKKRSLGHQCLQMLKNFSYFFNWKNFLITEYVVCSLFHIFSNVLVCWDNYGNGIFNVESYFLVNFVLWNFIFHLSYGKKQVVGVYNDFLKIIMTASKMISLKAVCPLILYNFFLQT